MNDNECRTKLRAALATALEKLLLLDEVLISSVQIVKDKGWLDVVDRYEQYQDICKSQHELLQNLTEKVEEEPLDFQGIDSQLNRFYGMAELLKEDTQELIKTNSKRK